MLLCDYLLTPLPCSWGPRGHLAGEMVAPPDLPGPKTRETAVRFSSEAAVEAPSFSWQTLCAASYTLAEFPRGRVWLKVKVVVLKLVERAKIEAM